MNKKRPIDILKEKYEQVNKILTKYNVLEVRIFGSVASNKDKTTSDVDFIMKLDDKTTLVDFGKLKYEIEEVLNLPTDILTYSGVNDMILEHFKKISISFNAINDLTEETSIEDKMTPHDKVTMNLKSIIWVIDRIHSQFDNMLLEDYLNNEVIQDSITRNIQLLSQIVSQIPHEELISLKHIDVSILMGIKKLKEAMFMNVDHGLVYKTINRDLREVYESTKEELENR